MHQVFCEWFFLKRHLPPVALTAGDGEINFISEKVAEMCPARVWTRWCLYRENNSRYAEVCSTCSGTDKYVSESVQTLKGPAKNKQVQTDCVALVDSGESHHGWAMGSGSSIWRPLRWQAECIWIKPGLCMVGSMRPAFFLWGKRVFSPNS